MTQRGWGAWDECVGTSYGSWYGSSAARRLPAKTTAPYCSIARPQCRPDYPVSAETPNSPRAHTSAYRPHHTEKRAQPFLFRDNTPSPTSLARGSSRSIANTSGQVHRSLECATYHPKEHG